MCAKANMVQTLTIMGSIGEQTLKDAVDKVSATHKTVNSIHSLVTETSNTTRLQLIAREWFSLLESGRKPTTKNPSPDMIKLLTDYAQARGMSNPESAAWAIAKTINKEGDKTYRSGGRDVYSKELDKFVEEVTEAVMKEFKGFYVNEIQNAFK
jgi:hypothetical protein